MKSYLQHHGILGQKWGVRRYQNEDGSLTAAGRKRLVKNASDKDILDSRKRMEAYDKNSKHRSDLADKQLNRWYDLLEEHEDWDEDISEEELMKDPEYRKITESYEKAVQKANSMLKYDLATEIDLSRAKTGKEKTSEFIANIGTLAVATLVAASTAALYASGKRK